MSSSSRKRKSRETVGMKLMTWIWRMIAGFTLIYVYGEIQYEPFEQKLVELIVLFFILRFIYRALIFPIIFRVKWSKRKQEVVQELDL